MVVVYVYYKEGKIKVLNHEEALKVHKVILKEGWIHTQTIDACLFLQFLYNELKGIDIHDHIKSLGDTGAKTNKLSNAEQNCDENNFKKRPDAEAKPVLCELKKPCCERCNGSGLSPDGQGFSDTPYVCPECNGSGR